MIRGGDAEGKPRYQTLARGLSVAFSYLWGYFNSFLCIYQPEHLWGRAKGTWNSSLPVSGRETGRISEFLSPLRKVDMNGCELVGKQQLLAAKEEAKLAEEETRWYK